MWIAAITRQMGAMTPEGFVLDGANIQVFEEKLKVIEAAEG
jgi:hypothetical protein